MIQRIQPARIFSKQLFAYPVALHSPAILFGEIAGAFSRPTHNLDYAGAIDNRAADWVKENFTRKGYAADVAIHRLPPDGARAIFMHMSW